LFFILVPLAPTLIDPLLERDNVDVERLTMNSHEAFFLLLSRMLPTRFSIVPRSVALSFPMESQLSMFCGSISSLVHTRFEPAAKLL
jgi:hypothetical protein